MPSQTAKEIWYGLDRSTQTAIKSIMVILSSFDCYEAGEVLEIVAALHAEVCKTPATSKSKSERGN